MEGIKPPLCVKIDCLARKESGDERHGLMARLLARNDGSRRLGQLREHGRLKLLAAAPPSLLPSIWQPHTPAALMV